MTRGEKKGSTDLWDYYQSIQLTPEQKAASRERLKIQAEEAARNGVYERFLALRGKVHLDVDFYRKLREDED
jgi:hypothetical protein